jgi:hypothetical protein
MQSTGYFKALSERKNEYATVAESIKQFEYDDVKLGFYPDEIEPWITVLCEKCGMEVHSFLAEQLQAKHI